MFRLSIIIPMYNSEKYISDCLDSILHINLNKEDYEVIIVNDGSTDKSKDIVDTYIANNDNFKYIEQENLGAAYARNAGLKHSEGEYVWFVDADDKIDSSEFEKAIEELRSHKGIEVLAFYLKEVTEKGQFINVSCKHDSLPLYEEISGTDAIVKGYSPSSVCSMFVRLKMIKDNELFFRGGMTHEDVEFTYRMMAVAKSVVFTEHIPYLYIYHDNTVTTSINVERKTKYMCDELLVYQSFMSLAERHSDNLLLSSTIKNRADDILFGLLLTLFRNRKQWSPLGINKAVIDRMIELGLYPINTKPYSWKKKIILSFLNIKRVVC
ncbi:MAG: glycosyltransferase [Prevotella sp.]|nr:glycosyltransferase [Prevotella sp.]